MLILFYYIFVIVRKINQLLFLLLSFQKKLSDLELPVICVHTKVMKIWRKRWKNISTDSEWKITIILPQRVLFVDALAVKPKKSNRDGINNIYLFWRKKEEKIKKEIVVCQIELNSRGGVSGWDRRKQYTFFPKIDFSLFFWYFSCDSKKYWILH